MRRELHLGPTGLVVELGSNDGYLLRNFVAAGVPVLGIEPAQNVAPRRRGRRGHDARPVLHPCARAGAPSGTGRSADLIACNNTLAQIPDLNDVVAGMAELLAPTGLITIEVPHLLRLLRGRPVRHDLPRALLVLLAGDPRPDHDRPRPGGRGRRRAADPRRVAPRPRSPRRRGGGRPAVPALIAREREAGLEDVATYATFGPACSLEAGGPRAHEWREAGQTVAGYGAPGKANTFLNYCGIGPDLLPFTVDRNPYKHGRFTPGMRIPIHPPDRIEAVRPDIVWILPWNLERRDRRPAGARRGLGRPAVRGHPEAAAPGPGAARRRRVAGAAAREGRAVLRRPGASPAGLRGDPAQADGADRPASDPVAHHALLRPLRVQGLPALSRLQGRCHQGLLPALQRGAVERLRPVRRRSLGGADADGHPGLADHVRRHGAAGVGRRASRRSVATSRTRRSSLPTTPTS